MPIVSKIIKVPVKKVIDREILKEKEYTLTKEGRVTYVEINQIDLVKIFPDTEALLECECDKCHATYHKHTYGFYDDGEFLCNKCRNKKRYSDKEFVNRITKKQKETFLDHYGTEIPMRLQEVKNKMFQTNQERYGYDWPMQNPDLKKQMYQNFISACKKKYNSDNCMRNSEIKQKVLKSLLKNPNNNIFVSNQQKHICKLLKGVLNYPFYEFVLDIAFIEDKIAIEYNGGGHDLSVKAFHVMTQEEFDLKEEKRYKKLNELGWKVIVFTAKHDKLPSDKKILEIFESCKNDDRQLIQIDLES